MVTMGTKYHNKSPKRMKWVWPKYWMDDWSSVSGSETPTSMSSLSQLGLNVIAAAAWPVWLTNAALLYITAVYTISGPLGIELSWCLLVHMLMIPWPEISSEISYTVASERITASSSKYTDFQWILIFCVFNGTFDYEPKRREKERQFFTVWYFSIIYLYWFLLFWLLLNKKYKFSFSVNQTWHHNIEKRFVFCNTSIYFTVFCE